MTETEQKLFRQFCAFPNGMSEFDDERFIMLALELINNGKGFPEEELESVPSFKEDHIYRLNKAFYWIKKTHDILLKQLHKNPSAYDL